MAARKSKARRPAKAKAKAKTKASSSRAAAARRAAAVRSARAKSARKAPARKAAAKKPAAKRAAPKKTVAKRRAPVRRAAPRPAPAPAVVPPVSMPTPSEPPAAAPAAEPAANMGDGGEGAEEDQPRRRGDIREAVASFATRSEFREAVRRLLAAGFTPADLSILASHDSLEVAGSVPGYRGKPGEALLAGLTDEAGLLAPLQVAGFSALSGGPVAAAVAALVTAGIGALGLREVIDRVVANRHSSDYVAALKAGNLLLWVRVAGPQQEWRALYILGDCGGANVHLNTRPAPVA